MDYPIPVTVKKNIEVKGVRVGDYIYDKETDTLYYELPYPFPCKFAVKALETIEVTPMMLRLPTFLKYHNIDWLQQQLTQVHLIQNNMVLIHGAAWSEGNIGILAAGFPNSGKTSIVMRAMQRNSLFCSDENVVINDYGIMFPVKRHTSLNPWIVKEIKYPLTLKQKVDFVIAKIKAKCMPIFEPNIWVDLPYERYSIKLDKIVYLTPGTNSLGLLTDNEFPFYTNPLIQTYAYATGFDLDGLYKKYRGLLDDISNFAKR